MSLRAVQTVRRQDGRELVDDEKETIRKELVVAQEKYSPRPELEMLSKTTQYV